MDTHKQLYGIELNILDFLNKDLKSDKDSDIVLECKSFGEGNLHLLCIQVLVLVLLGQCRKKTHHLVTADYINIVHYDFLQYMLLLEHMGFLCIVIHMIAFGSRIALDHHSHYHFDIQLLCILLWGFLVDLVNIRILVDGTQLCKLLCFHMMYLGRD